MPKGFYMVTSYQNMPNLTRAAALCLPFGHGRPTGHEGALASPPAQGKVFLLSHKQDFPHPTDPVLANLKDGECAVFTPDGQGGFPLRGRIKVEDWAGLQ
jgi:hypothetical protein